MFSRSGKGTTSQYLAFREDKFEQIQAKIVTKDSTDDLPKIHEDEDDESDFEIKISQQKEAEGGTKSKRIG